ncbi:MAG: hypothetical protein KF718_04940 [Polyangiaceae bacterium]|nr:hypothetical protein [Polyangiaceae bacterium]
MCKQQALKSSLVLAGLSLGCLLVHELLHRWLASRDIVAVLLSPGAHSPLLSLAAALGFLGLRLTVALVLGPTLIVLAGCAATRWLQRARRGRTLTPRGTRRLHPDHLRLGTRADAAADAPAGPE